MPIFEYKAITPEGQAITGLAHGQTMEKVAETLAAKGLQVQSLAAKADDFYDPQEAVKEYVQANPSAPPQAAEAPRGTAHSVQHRDMDNRSPFDQHIGSPLFGGVPLVALDFFFKQLGVLLHAGINPTAALDTLSKQTAHPKLRHIILETKDLTREGRPISEGLRRYPEVFSPLMMSMIDVAEQGGFLSEQCNMLSGYIRHEIEIRTIIRRETFYPKMVIGASIFIILATNAIIASIKPGAQGLSSPLTTPSTWICLAPALIALFFFVKLVLPNPKAQEAWHRFLLMLPWFSTMLQGFAMAKFGRAFASLYRSGVPLPKSVALAADACGNPVVRQRIQPAIGPLESGAGITESLAQTGAFSPIVLDMVRTGEMTGNMDEMMNKCSEYFEEEGKTKARQGAVIFGVVVFLLVAVYVGFIVVSFWSGYGSTLNGAF